MKIGTKSVLFGAHCFFIHPFFLMIAWIKLYGFPLHPAIWFSFFFHDLGYLGKPNMDGEEGESHVVLGAKILHFLFDWEKEYKTIFNPKDNEIEELKNNNWKCIRYSKGWFPCEFYRYKRKWYNFSLYHSRFYAKKDNVNYSKLCVVDKLAISLEPYWLYLPRVILTGEIKEYMSQAKNNDGKYKTMKLTTKNQREWFNDVCDYLKKWAYEHKDLKVDNWTVLL